MTVKYLKEKSIVCVIFGSMLYARGMSAAADTMTDYSGMRRQSEALRDGAGFSVSATLGSVVAAVIKGFLGLLGIIFVFLIVLAGYNWMTSGGDEEKINKAKDSLSRAIIGIIIIIGAYAITYFVFSQIQGVDTGPIP